MSPERRAEQLEQVEADLVEVGCDYKVALDHGDFAKVRSLRPRLHSLGRKRLRLKYPAQRAAA